GYKSAFSADDLKSIKNITAPRIIALGGITPERVGEVIALGFGGYAVKGAANSFIKDSIITQ
ncbi:MAG: thiamine phosphate synthase, partial [Paramuribaculum sp.]